MSGTRINARNAISTIIRRPTPGHLNKDGVLLLLEEDLGGSMGGRGPDTVGLIDLPKCCCCCWCWCSCACVCCTIPVGVDSVDSGGREQEGEGRGRGLSRLALAPERALGGCQSPLP